MVLCSSRVCSLSTSLAALKGESCLLGAGRLLAVSLVAHGTSYLGEKANIGGCQGAVCEKTDKAFPEMLECRRPREQPFSLLAQFDQLIEQVGNLQALIVVFAGLPIAPGILMLQVVSEILLGIEAFILNLPSQPPGPHQFRHRSSINRQVAQIHEVVPCQALARHTARFMAVTPLEPMALILQAGDPAIQPIILGGAVLEALVTGVTRPGGLTCTDGIPHRRQVAVF